MIDHFVLLNEPRRPSLDPEALKQKFLALSAEAHPDRSHNASPVEKQAANDRYIALNAAYQCLHDPRDRMLHLLELESGSRPPQLQDKNIPAALVDLSFTVGQLCRQVDSFLAEKSRASSPVLKAQLLERGLESLDKLQSLQSQINTLRDASLAAVKLLDPAWESASPASSVEARRHSLPLEALEQHCRLLGYLGRWSQQIQERITQLAF